MMGGGLCAECRKKQVSGKPLQTKLAISEPGDAYEQEADRVAEQVLQMPSADVNRTRNGSGEQQVVQRRASSGATGIAEAPPIVHEVLNSPGQPLHPATRAFFEPRFGHDFSQVRVHTDRKAAESARVVDASAYTVGQEIVFAKDHDQINNSAHLNLLAHELTHVVQQQTEVRAPRRLSRRGPMPAPVRPPPVRQPGTGVRGSPMPSGGTYRAPIWVPDQGDNSLEAAFQRGAIRDYEEQQRLEQERPVATLERGGQAHDFVTEHGIRQHSWLGGPSGGGAVTVRVRQFHVLDMIEYRVGRANTEQDLENTLKDSVLLVALFNQAIDISKGRRLQVDVVAPTWTPFWDMPVFPQGFDPDGRVRLQVFEAAARKREQQVPKLKDSRLIPNRRRQRGCRIEPIAPLGDDPLSSLYCDIATGSPYSYRITIESSEGGATRRWAEIDSLRGNYWYECKCGYEALLSGEARGEGVAKAVLEKMDKQVLNHVDIARTCGLTYRYVVSSERVASILRDRWHDNVVITVVPFEGCT